MVTRHDMDKEATQRRIGMLLEETNETLEEISGSLTQLAYVATEYGIHEGFLSGSDRREDHGDGAPDPVAEGGR